MGFAGIQNFPTVGLIDGVFRANLEETGMGFDCEVECIAAAHAIDLLTTPYAFEPDQATALTEAGPMSSSLTWGSQRQGQLELKHRSRSKNVYRALPPSPMRHDG